MARTFEAIPIVGPADLQCHAPMWRDVLDDDGIDAGLYCDPVFIEQTARFVGGRAMLLVRVVDDGRTSGLIPFRLEHERLPIRVGPWTTRLVSARTLRLLDFEFAVRSSLDRVAVLDAALTYVSAAVGAELAFLDNVVVPASAAAPPAWSFRNTQTTYVVEMPSAHELYWAALGSKVRIELKRRAKKLEEKCPGAVELVKYDVPSQMGELHARATAVWSKSWHASVGSGMPPSLASLERLSAEGWVRSYVLMAGGVPIAYLCGYQYRNTYYYDSIGFDAAWGDSAPGTVLNYHFIDDLFAVRPPRVWDFGFGYNKYKEHLGNVSQERAQVWVPLKTRGRIALGAVALGEQLGTMGRNLAKRAGVFERLRNRRRRAPAAPQR